MLVERLQALPVARRRQLTWLAAVIATIVVGAQLYRACTYYMMDVEVFQDAGWALRRGQDLYSEDFPTRSGFRFIYPPFAALLFYPTTWAGPTTLQIIWTAATIAAVWAILWMVSRRLALPRPALAATLLLGPAFVLDPLWENVSFGQINVFLAVLVIADVLGFIPKPLRGLGIGVAAGIKITPAAFALLFLVRGQWGNVARSFGWFLVTVIIGFAVRFKESIYYWTDEFFAGNRGGAPTYEANQALSGLVARGGLTGTALEVVTLTGFVAGAVLAGVAAWRFERAGRSMLALMVVIIAVCVTGPYAVSHHWSIVCAGLPLLLTLRNKLALGIGVAFYLANIIAPYTVFIGQPDGRATSVGMWLWGNMQGIMGLVVLLALVATALIGRVPTEKHNAGTTAIVTG
ncbi:DUF2029 domain-containing protein [Corynebacterium sp. TAE3-ERU12]|uniref:glycosyltransferase family 87 protein n=1 Tax=Corynebacterium sp. TAE3-ERU12 TaxID=2849491 RepID=UPI001C473AEA|nr:glycosyltransferase family 87 protein [Corynebacterium sp. TAE3-ERU12]MBV7294380.1 DUF2029 domain-containing protein [Corynebacterium sp. TAE3-ERU12]